MYIQSSVAVGMVNNNNAMFLCLLCLSAFINLGSCIQCFVCSDQLGQKCADPFNNETISIEDCTYPQVCGKHQTKAFKDGVEQIITTRTCMDNITCSQNQQKDAYAHCSLCTSEFCNSSYLKTPLPSIMILLFCISKILQLCMA